MSNHSQEDIVQKRSHSFRPRPFFAAFLGFLCVLSVACSMGAFAADSQPAKQTDLCVMTFNIRYGTADDGENRWENRREMVVDVLRRHGPDVVGLQEALRFQIDAIREALPQYAEIGVGRDDGDTKGEYSAILYRKDRFDVNDAGTFWFSDTPTVPGSTHWGNQITRICTWARFVPKAPGQTFYMFNTHFDHQSQPSREKSAVLLAQRIRDRRHRDPVLVTGDFNAGEDNPAVQYLKGAGELDVAWNGLSKNPVPLVDTFRVLHPDASEVGTFHTFNGDRSRVKIDYVFALPGVEVLKADILHDNEDNRYPSDHFPVIAELRFPITPDH